MSIKTCVHCGGSFDGVTTAKLCSLECAFWLKAGKAESGCWLWRGVLNDSGYGQFNFRYLKDKAHRIAASDAGSLSSRKMRFEPFGRRR